MRRDEKDERDQHQLRVVEACRSYLNAPQARLWLRRGAALGGLVAGLRRCATKQVAAGRSRHAKQSLGDGGPSIAGTPDG